MTDIILEDSAWEGLEEGSEAMLDEWLVAKGDSVTAGQVLGTVMVVKSTHELTAPIDGVVAEICVAEQAHFAQGVVLAKIS